MSEENGIKSATGAFEKALKEQKVYVLKLFVSGMTPRSLKAIQNTRRICRDHLDGRYELEVIDIYQQPELGKREQIIAAPTLIKKLPMPLRQFIGDLSDTDKILVGLDLIPKRTK
ncbi:MAG: circadian clock KaiB family protein [Thermodesulfobacteriota bacterium]